MRYYKTTYVDYIRINRNSHISPRLNMGTDQGTYTHHEVVSDDDITFCHEKYAIAKMNGTVEFCGDSSIIYSYNRVRQNLMLDCDVMWITYSKYTIIYRPVPNGVTDEELIEYAKQGEIEDKEFTNHYASASSIKCRNSKYIPNLEN